MTATRTPIVRLLACTALLFVVAFGVPAAADAQTTNQKIPFSMDVFVECANGGAGELVSFSGTLHILMHTSVDANGCTRMVTQFQPMQLSGTGAVTGASYQGTGGTKYIEKLFCDEESCIVEQTFVNNFKLIGQGPGNNSTVHQTIKITYNICTEEMTTEILNETIKCQ